MHDDGEQRKMLYERHVPSIKEKYVSYYRLVEYITSTLSCVNAEIV